MTSQKVFKFDEINLKHFNYETPQKKGQSYFSNISFKQKPIHIISPKLKCLSHIKDIIQSKSSMLDVEAMNHDHSFYDFLTNLDLKNIQTTFNNSKKWFDKEIPIELIEDMYKRSNKPIKKGEHPKMSFKLPIYKEQLQCPIYNQNNDLINIDNIEENAEVILCIHIKGLKILRSTYYCDIYISQIKIFQTNNKFNLFKECIFSKETNDNNYEDENDLIDTEYISQIKKEKENKILDLKSKLFSIQGEKKDYLQKIESLDKNISKLENELLFLKENN